MSHILTLVAANPDKALTKSHVKALADIAAFYHIEFDGKPVVLSKNKAMDIALKARPHSALMDHFRDELKNQAIDVFASPVAGRKKRLLLADMDSTIVAEETLDELAAYAGLKDDIAAITKQAMEGHLDFHEALRKRVALLKGLEAAKLQETLDATQINPGADMLVRTMTANGATCVLVSGGFTFFTKAIAQTLGFHHNHGNVLEIENDILSGSVREPIEDKHAKLSYLRRYCEDLGLSDQEAITIGDGANDLPMLKAAGLGIGYHAKPLVTKELDNLIIHGDLSAALYAQGYTDKEILKEP